MDTAATWKTTIGALTWRKSQSTQKEDTLESIGTVNSQQHTVLRQVPEQIRFDHQGEYIILDRYTGAGYGQVKPGDYLALGLHLSIRWVIDNPTLWQKVR